MAALRVTHAVIGAVMVLTAVLLATFTAGGWGLIGLAVLGLFVLLSSYGSYDRSDRAARA